MNLIGLSPESRTNEGRRIVRRCLKAFAALILISTPAAAQYIRIQVPPNATVGVPVTAVAEVVCPPPGDAPPPWPCNGSNSAVDVVFQSSDATATLPAGTYGVPQSQPVTFG